MTGLIRLLPLDTPRLRLRLFLPTDADALYEIQRDPLLTRYAGGTRNREESRRSLERIIDRTKDHGLGPLAVEDLETNEVLGWCGIQRYNNTARYEIIYALKVRAWGKGYATEASSAIIQAVAGLTDLRITEIWGVVYPQNLRSIRVLEKLGMHFVENHLDENTNRFASMYMMSLAERDQRKAL